MLIGTSMSRRSSRTACSEIASIDADLAAGRLDERHDARGRQRDAALRQRNAVLGRGDQQRLLDVLVIVERLAHAHHHHIGDGPAVALRPARAARRRHQPAIVGPHAAGKIAQPLARHQHLAEDFARASDCAPASACRCGRTSRSACSRPATTRTACRDRLRGCRRSRSRPAAGSGSSGRESGTAICACRRPKSARRRSPADRAGNCRPASARKPFWILLIRSKSVTPLT